MTKYIEKLKELIELNNDDEEDSTTFKLDNDKIKMVGSDYGEREVEIEKLKNYLSLEEINESIESFKE